MINSIAWDRQNAVCNSFGSLTGSGSSLQCQVVSRVELPSGRITLSKVTRGHNGRLREISARVLGR